MSENDLSRKIRDLRTKHSLTLEQVAQQVGVGRSTVRKWETGMIENLRRDKIAKLAAALHTTPAYLMGWDDVPPLSEHTVYTPCNLFSPIKRFRKMRGLSLEEAAEKIGLPLAVYSAVENGCNVDCITLARIAEFYCCSADVALAFDGEVNEEYNERFQQDTVLRLHRAFVQLSDEDQERVISFAQRLSDGTKNTLKVAARNGSYREYHLTDQQLHNLEVLLDQQSDVPDDL